MSSQAAFLAFFLAQTCLLMPAQGSPVFTNHVYGQTIVKSNHENLRQKMREGGLIVYPNLNGNSPTTATAEATTAQRAAVETTERATTRPVRRSELSNKTPLGPCKVGKGSCKPIRRTVRVNVDGCKETLRNIKVCHGTCPSCVEPKAVLAGRRPFFAKTLCSCCKPTKTKPVKVKLDCNGKKEKIYLQGAVECGCQQCGGF